MNDNRDGDKNSDWNEDNSKTIITVVIEEMIIEIITII